MGISYDQVQRNGPTVKKEYEKCEVIAGQNINRQIGLQGVLLSDVGTVPIHLSRSPA